MKETLDFRERLLAAERVRPDYEEKYRKEVQAMFEEKLTHDGRWIYVLGASLGVGLALGFAALAVMTVESGWLLRAGFGVGSFFGAAWAVTMGWIAAKGTVNQRVHPLVITGMAWALIVLMVALFVLRLSQLRDALSMIPLLLLGIVALGAAAILMILNRVDQIELRAREKLLEMEYRLAALTEDLENLRER